MSTAIANFHARAGLDVSDWDKGADEMAVAINRAAREVDNAWGLINNSSKSAKASASVFAKSGLGPIHEQQQLPDDRVTAARVAQTVQANEMITASMDRVNKSARESAAVFEAAYAEQARAAREVAQAEELLADQRIQQAQRVNASITAQANVITKSARESAAVFEAAYAEIRQELHLTGIAFESANRRIRSLNQGQLAGSKAASRFGLVMQQAGYQVQDFAVQVAAGQNKMVAFAQQGSQLVSFFGPKGAIVGAALSVGVLAYQLFDASRQTKKATEETREWANVLKEIDDLRKKIRFDGMGPQGKINDIKTRIANLRDQERGYRRDAIEYSREALKDDEKAEAAANNANKARLERLKLDEELKELQKEVAKDARKENEERRKDALDLASVQRQLAMENIRMTGTANQIRKAEEEEIMRLAKSTVASERLEGTRRMREMVEQRRKEADIIKDALDPMRERLRLQEELNVLVEKGFLTQKEAARYLAEKYKPALDMFNPGANSYQRVGLNLGGNVSSSGSAEELRRHTELLRSIDRKLGSGVPAVVQNN